MYLIPFWCAVLILLAYFYLKKNYDYWQSKNIPHEKPNLLFGNLKDLILMKKSMGQKYTDLYNAFSEFPYIGFYKMRTPGIILRDPQLIYDITIKDFHHFEANDMKINEKIDPLAAKNPFFLTGERWKHTRSKLSACFTSGKLKMMFPLTVKVSKDMVKYLEENEQSGTTTFETKELSAKFTTDNVASCAFGLEGKSFEDENAEFRSIGKMILTPSVYLAIKMLLITFFPSLNSVLKAKFVPAEADAYLRNIVASAIKYREEHKIVRNDFLDIINFLREKEKDFTLEDVTAYALSFFADGFETSSITLSFTLFALACNLNVQEKARNEIKEVLARSDGSITYDGIQEMNYLDCVVSESLRLYPPGMSLFKLCTQAYELPPINGNEKKLLINADTPIVIPIYGIHYDQKYYPDPEKFDPERFSDENKSSIMKGTYLPFGNGPRACLGQRFALLQVKVAVVALLNNFDIRLNKKTKVPIEIDENYFMLLAKGGLWLDYFRRKH